MNDRDRNQVKQNDELLQKLGIVDNLPLKKRYVDPGKAKSAKRAKAGGNSGNTGKAGRRKRNTQCISQYNSPEQFILWVRSQMRNEKSS